MQCAESLRIQAYFDGEVDAISAADIERHAEHCPACRALLGDLAQTRARLQRDLEYPQAPQSLRERIARTLDAEAAADVSRAADASRVGDASRAADTSRVGDASRAPGAPRPARPSRALSSWRTRPFWQGALGGAVCALAAGLAFMLLFTAPRDALLDEVVAAHVRSLMPEHLTDVVSTDRHTVKPWFAGHADVSPVVADFAPEGYRLVGGRADYFGHQRAAVVVYEHGAHVINVFAWVAGGERLPDLTTRSGYHVAFWRVGNLQYAAVTDAGWDELLRLVRLLRDLGESDAR